MTNAASEQTATFLFGYGPETKSAFRWLANWFWIHNQTANIFSFAMEAGTV